MNSILMSIRPKWCKLIESGKKKIEVRKSFPKIKTPFKVYIYMTKAKPYCLEFVGNGLMEARNGKIIGEFICDKIITFEKNFTPHPELGYSTYDNCGDNWIEWNDEEFELEDTCISENELKDYIGKNRFAYGFHISSLKIYDKPRELSEFYTYKKCTSCESGYESSSCIYDEKCIIPVMITRPPQSWMYAEENNNTGVEV